MTAHLQAPLRLDVLAESATMAMQQHCLLHLHKHQERQQGPETKPIEQAHFLLFCILIRHIFLVRSLLA